MHFVIDVLNYTTALNVAQTRLSYRYEKLVALLTTLGDRVKSHLHIHLCVKYHTMPQRSVWVKIHRRLQYLAKKMSGAPEVHMYLVRAPYRCITQKTGLMSVDSHNECEPDDYLVLALANVLSPHATVVSNDKMRNARLTVERFAPYYTDRRPIERAPIKYATKIAHFSQYILDSKRRYKLKAITKFQE